MQRQVAQLQEELAKRTFTGAAGGGAVNVTVNGKKEFVSVEIKPEVVDPGEVEMLEDLIGVALKDALQKAEEASSEAMKGVTGGLGLPGMP